MLRMFLVPLFGLLLTACASADFFADANAGRVEITNSGFVTAPAGAGGPTIVLGSQRINVETLPVYALDADGNPVMFQSRYVQAADGSIETQDMISFCGVTRLGGSADGAGGGADTRGGSASGQAAQDCWQWGELNGSTDQGAP